jgi:hypothetical protein
MAKKSDKWITVVPAYGRDYKNAEEVLLDWCSGKDFKVADISCRWNGAYCSERDFHPESDGSEYQTIKIRHNKLADIVLVRLNSLGEWEVVGRVDAVSG